MAKLTGTKPEQVPTNGDLGTMAYQDKDNVSINGGSINLKDNDKIQLGDSSDLEIYHDGSNSYVRDAGAGDLMLQGSGSVFIQNGNGSETMAHFIANGAVALRWDNITKLATTSTGIDVTGTVTMDGGSTSGDFTFGDSDKVIFGSGSDLRIYHDPGTNNSFIDEQGSGNLIIRGTQTQIKASNGSDMADFTSGGAARLFFSNAAKLATTSSGIDVTGTVTATSYAGDGSALTGIGPSTTFGDVGTYAFLVKNGTSVTSGSSVAGSSLQSGGVNAIQNLTANNTVYNANSTGLARGDTTMSGTWRAMGSVTFSDTSTYGRGTIFLRIS